MYVRTIAQIFFLKDEHGDIELLHKVCCVDRKTHELNTKRFSHFGQIDGHVR